VNAAPAHETARALQGAAGGPRVAVVVPARDRLEELERLLAGLEAQTLPADAFEVIVADDGSRGSLEGLRARHPRALVAPGPPRNSYSARNRGARSAAAPVLAFCDSDCEPAADWLEAGLAALEHADVVAGRVRRLLPEAPTVWTLLDVDKFLDQERWVRAGRAVTANLLVRRATFEAVGGFSDDFASGGDFDFVDRCVEAGARLSFASDAVVEHPTLDDGRAFLRKVWRVHSRRAPVRPALRDLVPFLARLRRGRPLGLDRARLADEGLNPTARQRIAALVLLSSVVPWLEFAAQLSSWVRARRTRPG
jgi:GT2 family glycosyltransferase